MPAQQQHQALMLGMRRQWEESQAHNAKRSWKRREQQAILRSCLPFGDTMQTSIALAGFLDRKNYENGNCFFKTMEHLGFGPAVELRQLVRMRLNKLNAPEWVQMSLSNSHGATCIGQVQWAVKALSADFPVLLQNGLLVANVYNQEWVHFTEDSAPTLVKHSKALRLML